VSSPRRALGYLPALDGLRALAVAAVLAYHLGYGAMPGGYIGVEVFFVLSGWLVCALLHAEHEHHGRIDLRQFWVRRFRRLIPAVGLAIGATLVVTTLTRYDRFLALRGDALAALAYILNWRYIFENQSYFEAAAGPSPLQHLWSLSIEEQFYLVLPLLLGLVLATRFTARRAPLLVLGLAGLSTAWRFALEAPGVDPSRIYYGTDTRAAGLLAGATLALVWVPGKLRPVAGRWAPFVLDVVGLAALAVVGRYAVEVGEHDPDAFGLALTTIQLATVVLIAVVVHPVQGLVAKALSLTPLRWVGQRSYGIYLWHWPIVVAVAAAPGEQPEAPWRSAAIVVATLLLAGISFRWVEQPIRQRGFLVSLADLWRWLGGEMLRRPATAGLVTGVVLVLLGVVGVTGRHLVTAPADVELTAEMAGGPLDTTPLDTTPVDPTPVDPTATTAPTTAAAGAATTAPGAPTTVVAGAQLVPGQSASGPVPVPPGPGTPATTLPPVPVLPPITGIGDSVMLGAAPALAARLGPSMQVEAKVGRQMVDTPGLVADLAEHGRLGEVVVLHLGANGPFPDETIDDIVDVAGDRQVLLLNVKVPRRWEGEVNDRIVAAAQRHRRVTVVDWRKVADAEPGLLSRDGYHLTPIGQQRYSEVVAAAVTKAVEKSKPSASHGHRTF
jgi:peptidoglycan/LPS O-acetylase OafA/YrhL